MCEAKVLRVVCAVFVDREGRYFAVKRPPDRRLGGLWEFPGGKIEPGETPEDALVRELNEELEFEASHLELFCSLTPVRHEYDFAIVELVPFLLRCHETPVFTLMEHTDFCWISRKEANALAWAPADIPILEQLDW